ncbi:MAG: ABC transporter permease subunit [Thermaerobacter sp.]|jgi:hypothetical protein|nr:ABC transporter permease subunit [Thermaerobacter sp.]
MMTTHWTALLRNELVKLWHRKGRATLFLALALAALTAVLAQHAMEQERQALAMEAAMQRHALRQAAPGFAVNPTLRHLTQTNPLMPMAKGGPAALERRIAALQALLRHAPTASATYHTASLALALDRYYLAHAHGHTDQVTDNGWRLVGLGLGGSSFLFLGLLIVYLLGDLVAGERRDGTLSFLFLHQARRGDAFLAKAAAGVLAAWSLVLLTAAGTFLFGAALMGFGSDQVGHAVALRYVSLPPQSFPLAGPGTAFIPGSAAVAPALGPYHVVSQLAYDGLALGLALVTAAALALLVAGLSVVARSPSTATLLGTLLVLSGIFSPLAAGHWYVLLDPGAHLPLMADYTGRVSQALRLSGADLELGLAVLAGWVVAALALGTWRFGRLDPTRR